MSPNVRDRRQGHRGISQPVGRENDHAGKRPKAQGSRLKVESP
jgi:hypothetical protein